MKDVLYVHYNNMKIGDNFFHPEIFNPIQNKKWSKPVGGGGILGIAN